MRKMETTWLLRLATLTLFLGAFNYAQAQISCNCDVDLNAAGSATTVVPGSAGVSLSNIGATSDISWNWYRDGNIVQTCNCPTYTATKPGSYQMLSNSCTEASQVVELQTITSVSPTPPSSSSTLNSTSTSTIANTIYLLNSDVDFSSISTSLTSLTFVNCTFVFGNGVSMKIPEYEPSGTNALDVTFTGCGFYGDQGAEWDGIYVEAGNSGGDVLFYQSHFREATFAIHQDGERNLEINECEFGKNGVHVAVQNTTSSSTIIIQNNLLGDVWPDVSNYNSSYHPYQITTDVLYTHLWLNDCDDFSLASNIHAETVAEIGGDESFGVYMQDCDGIDLVACYFDGRLTNGVRLESGNLNITAEDCLVNSSPRYLQDVTASPPACNLHDMLVLTGIYSYDTDNLHLENNFIDDCSYGVQIYSPTTDPSCDIYHNTFDDNAYAIVLATDVNPLINTGNSTGVTQDVDITCNKIYNSDLIGIVGYGTIKDQGQPRTSTSPGVTTGTDASNMFSGSTYYNMFIDDGGGTAMNYYFNDASAIPVSQGNPTYNLSLTITSTPVTLEGSTATNTINLGVSAQANSCHKSWKKGITTDIDDIEETGSEYTVYPNPFNGNLTVDLSNGSSTNYTIVLTDITGKVISQNITNSTDNYTLTTTELSAGVYFIKVLDAENNLAHQQKLVKVH